jgi:hypothetical protein
LNKALNVLIPQEIDEENDIIDTATNKISAA